MASLDGKTLLFIGGVPRSGTTWTQLLLAAHPDIASGRETHIFGRYVNRMFEIYRKERDENQADGLSKYFDRAEYTEVIIKGIVTATLEKIADRKPEARVVLEKTPSNIWNTRMIRKLFGRQARFLHIVRDPRSVYASLKAASGEDWGDWADMTPEAFAHRWVGAQIRAAGACDLFGEGYREIAYETLRADPHATMKAACDWLGILADEATIAAAVDQNDLARLKTQTRTDDKADPAQETRANFFRTGKTDGWKSELTGAEIEAIERIAAEPMAALGYRPAHEQGRPAVQQPG